MSEIFTLLLFQVEKKEEPVIEKAQRVNHADMEVVVESGPLYENEAPDYDDDYNEDEEKIVTASSLFAKTMDGRFMVVCHL